MHQNERLQIDKKNKLDPIFQTLSNWSITIKKFVGNLKLREQQSLKFNYAIANREFSSNSLRVQRTEKRLNKIGTNRLSEPVRKKRNKKHRQRNKNQLYDWLEFSYVSSKSEKTKVVKLQDMKLSEFFKIQEKPKFQLHSPWELMKNLYDCN